MSRKKNSTSTEFDYKSFEKSAIVGLQSSHGLVGENGFLKELMSHFLQNSRFILFY